MCMQEVVGFPPFLQMTVQEETSHTCTHTPVNIPPPHLHTRAHTHTHTHCTCQYPQHHSLLLGVCILTDHGTDGRVNDTGSRGQHTRQPHQPGGCPDSIDKQLNGLQDQPDDDSVLVSKEAHEDSETEGLGQNGGDAENGDEHCHLEEGESHHLGCGQRYRYTCM